MITHSPIRIGTRESALAIAQTQQVATALGVEYEIIPIISSGDKIKGSLRDHGGKGLFTKEIDAALIREEVDLAVHSMKDVETPLSSDLEIAVILCREDPRDVLIMRPSLQLKNPEKSITIGTSSLRRARQLTLYYPHLTILPCRGNIQTRLQKYARGEFDGIMLALAGLKRMNLFKDKKIDNIHASVKILDVADYVPASGQGALVVIKRSCDNRFDSILKKINHQNSLLAIQTERMVIDALNFTCHDPVGVYAKIINNEFCMDFMLFTQQPYPIRKSIKGSLNERLKLVQNLVEDVKKSLRV